MGEPLDNYENVVAACRALIDCKRWNLAHGRVTISTVGMIEQIYRLTDELPQVSLALSLHAPNQKLRESIVPTAHKYPIDRLIDAVDYHMMAYVRHSRKTTEERAAQRIQAKLKKGMQHPTNTNELSNQHAIEESERHGNEVATLGNTQTDPGKLPVVGGYSKQERVQQSSSRRTMIEYIMLDGPTSTLQCAHELGQLCAGRQMVVNLIPYNPTDVRDPLRCPPMDHVNEFRHIVAGYGTMCTIRRTMGADIDSACGQLITLQQQGLQRQQEKAQTGTLGNDVVPKSSPAVVGRPGPVPTPGKDHLTAPVAVRDIEDMGAVVPDVGLSSSLPNRDRASVRKTAIVTSSNASGYGSADRPEIKVTWTLPSQNPLVRRFHQQMSSNEISEYQGCDTDWYEGDDRYDSVVRSLLVATIASASSFVFLSSVFWIQRSGKFSRSP
jgi:hypothetical protein